MERTSSFNRIRRIARRRSCRNRSCTSDRRRARRGTCLCIAAAPRVSELVGQVLDFSGMQARGGIPRRERIDVPSVIDEAIVQSKWIAEEWRVAIEKDVANDLPAVEGDASSLARAVQNLIANAIRHGGDGGWVGVRAHR